MPNEEFALFNPDRAVQPDRTIYPGETIDVYYDRKRCIHAAECGRGLKEVFNARETPWIAPDRAETDRVAQVVARCPAGALTFTRKDGGAAEPFPQYNTILVSPDGPLYCRGRVVLKTTQGDELPPQPRVALCRCGASGNKPYCDGTHTKAKFHDAGPVASEAPEDALATGTLAVTVLPDGPLQCEGDFVLRAASGRAALVGQTAYLCRCGASGNKPFCDGAHAAAGFRDPGALP